MSDVDSRRIRFLSKFELSVTWNDRTPKLFWRGRASPGQPGGFFEISEGSTLEEAIDLAIDRWEKKHRRRFE